MADERRTGRPRASSRETIAEAACELFFEQGYDGTSITDITRRAGVARSSFFNYFAAKSDVLWAGFDARFVAAADALAAGADIHDALGAMGRDFAPDTLALAITNAEAMGLVDELERDRAARQRTVQRRVAARLIASGMEPLRAEVRAGADAAAVLAAVWAWADRPGGAGSLETSLRDALAVSATVGEARDSSGARLA